jgi:hypothetical protein
MRRHRLAALVTVGVIGVTAGACDGSVGGQATPDPTISANSSAASPSNSGAVNPFAGMNPCNVLDQALAGQGYPASVPTTADSKRSCATNKRTTGTDGIDVALSLQDGQAVDPGVGDVNGRHAIQERDRLGGTGSCDVQMEVKPNSRALVLITLRTGSTDEACAVSNDVSPRIEPLLPKNN